jgi:CheY-like chemotaxis protein
MLTQAGSISILIADDDEEDRALAARALHAARLANDLHFVDDGEQSLDYLKHRGIYTDRALSPRPGLMLLDLKMPKKDGFAVLRELRADPDLRTIPVVVLTTSTAEADIVRSYDLGVNSFISKPVTFAGLVDAMSTLGKYWFQIVALPTETQR